MFEILFLIFLTLKLASVIDWSWWLVTAPLWFAGAWYVFLFIWNVVVFSFVGKQVKRGLR